MTFSAVIPIANADAANATLLAAGWGPNNFATPLRPNGAAQGVGGSHAALYHLGNDPAFQSACAALPGCVVTTETFPSRAMASHAIAQSLEWTDPVFWFQNPVMTDDIRNFGGRDYRSLIDFNVWPTSYRAYWEDLGGGIPIWVQPTGAHDAYPLNFVVSHNGVTYRSTIPANVTVPGENVVFGWWVVI
jgi:hypothetical protein